MFSDEERGGWDTILCPKREVGDWCNRMDSKRYKILPQLFLPKCDYSIYMDARFTLKRDPLKLIKEMGSYELALCPHPERRSVWKEAEVVKSSRKDHSDIVNEQMGFYRGVEGFSGERGLAHCGFIIRKHTLKVAEFSLIWWDQIRKYSSRDQLSFQYSLFKAGLTYYTIPSQPANL